MVLGVPRKRLSGTSERPPAAQADAKAAAAYIAALTGELGAIARRHDFETLIYLLDMTRLEAEGLLQRLTGS